MSTGKKRATSITENVGIVEKQKSNNTKKYLARVVFCRAKCMLFNVHNTVFDWISCPSLPLSLHLILFIYVLLQSSFFFVNSFLILIPIRFTFCSLDPVLVLAVMMLVLDLINAYRKRSAAFLTLHPDSVFLFLIFFLFRLLHLRFFLCYALIKQLPSDTADIIFKFLIYRLYNWSCGENSIHSEHWTNKVHWIGFRIR